MGFATLAGQATGTVQPSGLHEFIAGTPFVAATQSLDLRDLQQAAAQSLLAGVMAGGPVTVSGLVLTFPAGFTYWARQVWQASGTTTYSVPDASTTYVWACSDGVIRPTSTVLSPTGFDGRSCCLVCKAVAAGGVATLDFSGQQRARTADATARKVQDGPLSLDYGAGVVDTSGAALRIPSVTADPTVPATGTFVWFRSDTLMLCVSVNGTVKRSAAFA